MKMYVFQITAHVGKWQHLSLLIIHDLISLRRTRLDMTCKQPRAVLHLVSMK